MSHWYDAAGQGQAVFLRLLFRDSQALPDLSVARRVTPG
jgi:hypothetical protein